MVPNEFKLSVVVPLFNEQEVVPIFVEELKKHAGRYQSYEIILVDDGSTDATFQIIKRFADTHSEIKYIRLSKNYGHQAALWAGLEAASGDCVVMMDGDLQHPPELIHKLIKKWKEGYQIVNTVRMGVEGAGIFKKITASAFYHMLNRISDINITPNAADYRLMDRNALRELLGFKEKNPFIRGLVDAIGFRKTTVEFVAPERAKGRPKYTLKKMFKLASDGVFSFSVFPMKLFIAIGTSVIFFDLTYAAFVIYARFFRQTVVSGWTSLMLVVLFLGGLNIISIGVLGGYIFRVFVETRNRPRYIVMDSNLEEGPNG